MANKMNQRINPVLLETMYRFRPDLILKGELENKTMNIGIDIPARMERKIAIPMVTMYILLFFLGWVFDILAWN